MKKESPLTTKDFGVNTSPLAYWKANTYSDADVMAVCQKIDDIHAIKVDFLGDRRVNVILSRKVGQTMEGHVPAVVRFFRQIVEAPGSPDLRGSFIVWVEDGMWNTPYQHKAPIFAFGKRYDDWVTFLMPDPAFIDAVGYKDDLAEIATTEEMIPWEKRKPALFWRGSSSGMVSYRDDWKESPRAVLVLTSKKLNDRSKLDAAFTKVVPYPDHPSVQEIPKLGLLDDPCKFSKFLEYRYLIDVDGEFCAWRSLFLKLASGSVVLKVQSDLEEWYHSKLIPWVHYIPINRSLSDLEDRMEWVRSHDKECKQIASNASQLMREIGYESERAEFGKLLSEILGSFRE